MSHINLSIDRSVDNCLVLRFTDFDLGTHGETVFEHKILPASIPDFLATVAQQGSIALKDVAKAIEYGDCDRCKNIRLIEAPTHPGSDRMWRVECPDCSAGVSPVPFGVYPLIGGGMSDEKDPR